MADLSSFPVPKKGRVSVSMTQGEYRKILIAQEYLQKLMSSQESKDLAWRTLGMSEKELEKELITPFENLVLKSAKSRTLKASTEKTPTEKALTEKGPTQKVPKESYFTRRIQATKGSVHLHDILFSAEKLPSLRVENQQEETCPFDISLMVSALARISGWGSSEMMALNNGHPIQSETERKMVWEVVKSVVNS